jgi:hypothetical protein
MMKLVQSVLIALVSMNAFALEVDTYVVGDSKFEKQNCIQLKKESCVNNFCVVNSPISEERNCPEICQKRAKEECLSQ